MQVIRGIEDPQELEEIERFSAGVPLAISLSCDLVLQYGAEKLKDSAVTRETIGQLVGKLLEGLNDDYYQNILDITSLLWRFDQDLLSDILGEPISNESFRRFCRLPFITVCERGWSCMMPSASGQNWIFSTGHLINMSFIVVKL